MAAETVSMTLDVSDARALFKRLGSRMPAVISRSINRAAKSARTAMTKAVREDVGLTAKVVRDAIVFTPARAGRDPRAKLTISKKRIPLIKFKARQLKRAGVKANLKGGARTYPGAFIATMRSGHRGVFKRTTAARLPITQLHGPSLAKVFKKKWSIGRARYRE